MQSSGLSAEIVPETRRSSELSFPLENFNIPLYLINYKYYRSKEFITIILCVLKEIVMDEATLFLRYYNDFVVRQSLYFSFGLPKTSVELLINRALNNVLARGSM